MKKAAVFVFSLFVVAAGNIVASGPLGIYAVIDKVVFEPTEGAPERVQLWGAFAYVDPDDETMPVSAAKRGYMYFRLPSPRPPGEPGPVGPAWDRHIQALRNEWADLKAVAGTGQAVGFGRWGYIGQFTALDPGKYHPAAPAWIGSDLRVRPASELPAAAADYRTNVGVVKIPDSGRHAPVVKALRAAR